ncbi:MAG: bifunctional UDP-N-acetylmuramoyl-tripeptide:D-alanyl-D-alanine ligase/alanine racemase [Bacteroidota bacterium]
MRFSELKDLADGDLTLVRDHQLSDFCIDTRKIAGTRDTVFVALEGSRDGNQFIEEAYRKGLRSFLSTVDSKLPGANVFKVSNTLHVFQQIARAHRRKFSIPIIGITGSNGKTTVKEWLGTILSQSHIVAKSPKSYNSQIGVPLSVLGLQSYHQFGVFEAGISQKGEMSALASIIQPDYGVFTNLGSAHDAGFASRSEKLEEKLKLFAKCKNVVVRADSEFYARIESVLGKNTLIPWSLKATEKALQVQWKDGKVYVDNHHFSTMLRTPTALENLTHAIVLALEMGMSSDDIQRGINLIKSIPMRMEWKRGRNNCSILDDSYNNDFAGLQAVLDSVELRQHDKKALILSDILHSTDEDEKLYHRIAALAVDKGFERIIGVGPKISSFKHLFSPASGFFLSTEDLLKHPPMFENELIVVKGARAYELEKVVQRLEAKTHKTVLEINQDALSHNLKQYRSRLNENTAIMAMVKANGYGAGLLEVASLLEHSGIDRLGVAYLDEAALLRQQGITLPIMIMNPAIEDYKQFELLKLEAEIFNLTHLKQLIADTDVAPAIHLKIDTGMHRLGFSEKELPELLEFLSTHPELNIKGILTHFSSADNPSDDEFTIKQGLLFEKVAQQIQEVLGYRPLLHACNSAGIVRWPQFHYDMVRVGIGLHGFDATRQLDLQVVSQLKTSISQIQELEKGECIGYGRKAILSRNSKIAIVPIGYEDGFSRQFGNGTISLIVNGQEAKTVGNICMDMTMLDVTDLHAEEGDEVIVFGQQPSISALAESANTIPYEILTNVSSRVKRVFVTG